MKSSRYEDNSSNSSEYSSSRNAADNEPRTERGNHPEIEQPNPSIATPGIPDEMPAREIK